MSGSRVVISSAAIDNLTFSEAISRIEQLIARHSSEFVVTPNVDHIVRLKRDESFRAIYRNAALVLTDGVPLLWAARFLGTPIKEKISGSDLLPRLCEVAAKKGYRLFFLGGRPGAAELAAENCRRLYPGIKICGVYSPPMGFENDHPELDKINGMIKKAAPDLLFVGLGSPKQEKWIYANKEICKVPVSIGIGVSFEFMAGIVKRAPRWMQKIGLEWLWRLAMEPVRLWRRYLGDTVFFWLIIRQKLKSK